MKNTKLISYFLLFDIFVGLGFFYFFFTRETPAEIQSPNNTEINTELNSATTANLSDNSIIKGKFTGSSTELTLEVAKSEEKQNQGLMFVENLNADEGMLFIFEKEKNLTFWMKNTLISLDMIFLDQSMQIISIQKEAKPNQTKEIYPSNGESKFVIELNAGKSDELNIDVGDKFSIL